MYLSKYRSTKYNTKEYNNKSLVPIIIEIKDNYDIENLKIQFIEENIPVKKRSSIIAKSMSEVVSKVKPIIEIIKLIHRIIII